MTRRDRLAHAARTLLRPLYRPLKRTTRFVAWALPALGTLLVDRSARLDRRVLIIYDLSSQPFSIGDFLIFQEAAVLLCEKFGVKAVDFALLHDPQSPASADPVFKARVDAENFLYHLASVLPVVQVNPYFKSLLVLDSREQLVRYVNDNIDRYHVWPSGWDLSAREYLSPLVFNRLLRDHYAVHGAIPRLSCRPFLAAWAADFYRAHVAPKVPITVNLRNNPAWHQARNSRMEAWIEFFDHCASRYPAVFVVICARSEIDARLRECPNVVVAKDHDTGVEQDMALIHGSAAHLGASSGPATMAWFNDRPYLMVNTAFTAGAFFSEPEMVEQLDEQTQRVWFAAPMQRVINAVESADMLIREFETMWPAIDVAAWAHQESSGREAPLQSWLR